MGKYLLLFSLVHYSWSFTSYLWMYVRWHTYFFFNTDFSSTRWFAGLRPASLLGLRLPNKLGVFATDTISHQAYTCWPKNLVPPPLAMLPKNSSAPSLSLLIWHVSWKSEFEMLKYDVGLWTFYKESKLCNPQFESVMAALIDS